MGKRKGKKINLKPIVLILIVIFVLDLFIVLGSMSRKKIKEDFTSVLDKMYNLANYSLDINVSPNVNINKKENINLNISQDFDFENNTFHIKYNSFNFKYEKYSVIDLEDENNDRSYFYDIVSKQWLLSNKNVDDVNKKEIISLLYNSSNIKKEGIDKNKLDKYVIILDNKKALSNITLNQIINNYNLKNSDLASKIKVEVYVNSEKYIKKMVMKLVDSKVKINIGNKNYSIKEMNINFSFDKYNSLNLIISEDIINNAVLEDYILTDESEDVIYNEEQIMYDIVLGASIYCKPKTINFSNYNNELDKYLRVNRYNINNIKSGIIVIDDKCHVTVEEPFKIKNKICTYSIENAQSCQ